MIEDNWPRPGKTRIVFLTHNTITYGHRWTFG
jgi:hypothetical protein